MQTETKKFVIKFIVVAIGLAIATFIVMWLAYGKDLTALTKAPQRYPNAINWQTESSNTLLPNFSVKRMTFTTKDSPEMVAGYYQEKLITSSNREASRFRRKRSTEVAWGILSYKVENTIGEDRAHTITVTFSRYSYAMHDEDSQFVLTAVGYDDKNTQVTIVYQ